MKYAPTFSLNQNEGSSNENQKRNQRWHKGLKELAIERKNSSERLLVREITFGSGKFGST